jgi:hypothetical protein
MTQAPDRFPDSSAIGAQIAAVSAPAYISSLAKENKE